MRWGGPARAICPWFVHPVRPPSVHPSRVSCPSTLGWSRACDLSVVRPSFPCVLSVRPFVVRPSLRSGGPFVPSAGLSVSLSFPFVRGSSVPSVFVSERASSEDTRLKNVVESLFSNVRRNSPLSDSDRGGFSPNVCCSSFRHADGPVALWPLLAVPMRRCCGSCCGGW